jgi:UDP-glucose 4-epimerase
MKKILVTGAAGLVGSNFVEFLSKKDIKVCAVDNLTGGNHVVRSPHVEFHKCDVESDRFEQIFSEFKPDVVYHMAAYAAEGLSPFIRKFNYTNNLISTANVVNCCIQYGVKRLVFLSSMAVYGNQYEPPFHEDLIPNPIDPYGIAKYACEMDIRVAGEQHGLDWCIIRPHNVYGEKQNIWDRYRNVLGIWMWKHIQGEPITIFGDGQQERAFSYIADCMRPLFLAGISPSASKEIINLGGKTSISIEGAADTLIDVMGGGEKVFLEGRHETKYAYSTWDKSVDILEYSTRTPETSFKDGLTNMWAWAKEASQGVARQWHEYEIDKGLYNFWKNENDAD